MPVLRQLALGRRANALGWRVGCAELRIRRLELLELAKQNIVIAVRERRAVEDVILVRRLVDLATQVGGTRGVRGRGRHGECDVADAGPRPRQRYPLASSAI